MEFTLENLIKFSQHAYIIDIMQVIHEKLLMIPDYYFINNPYFYITGFYRARNHDNEEGVAGSKFLYDKEFWNPPKQAITTLGRCNTIGESLFYCTNKF